MNNQIQNPGAGVGGHRGDSYCTDPGVRCSRSAGGVSLMDVAKRSSKAVSAHLAVSSLEPCWGVGSAMTWPCAFTSHLLAE